MTLENAAASASTIASCRGRETTILVSDAQTWPDSRHSACASAAAAVSMSASSRMTAADLPPSSSVTRAIRSPQIDAIRRPAAVDPVKVILSTRGIADEQLGDLAVGADHVEHAGRQADGLGGLGDHVPLARRLGEVFSTTVHPASSAGASFIEIRPIGAFHGMIAPTTPTGSLTTRPKPPRAGLAGRSHSNVSARSA